eukprot:TRINITY_DN40999_c0_g1_i1.p1 TRINITY_DN40999_c0_g1~~TRINITY_DN40999_c0_g1_i1.p1  ORF type:complete len:333 (+),score=85.76 TRINITY_DN40999_c0_g1_i1:271-1269(+)
MGAAAKNTLYVEFLRHVARARAISNKSRLFQGMRPLLDLAVAKMFQQLTARGMMWDDWLDVHEGMAFMIFDEDAVRKVCVEEGNYVAVEVELNQLYTGSQLGQPAFVFAKDICANRTLDAQRTTHLNEDRASAFHADAVVKMQESCQSLGKSFQRNMAAKRREIKIRILGVNISFVVGTVAEEVELRSWAKIKNAVIGRKDGLVVLGYEKLVISAGELCPETPYAVPRALFGCMAAARNLFVEMISRKKPVDLEVVVKQVDLIYDSLLSLDRSFRIEKEMLQKCQSLIDENAQKSGIACLSNETHEATPGQSSVLLVALQHEDMFKLASVLV